MLTIQFLSEINFLHVIVAGLAYWLVGAIWYMGVFSKPWATGVEKWGIKITKPDSGSMMKKMVVSLLCNVGAALVLAWYIQTIMGYNAILGFKIGFCGGILVVMASSIGDNWLSKPMNTYLIDATHHIAGLTLCGLIIGAWH